jgi:large subunit ribosomal protein L34
MPAWSCEALRRMRLLDLETLKYFTSSYVKISASVSNPMSRTEPWRFTSCNTCARHLRQMVDDIRNAHQSFSSQQILILNGQQQGTCSALDASVWPSRRPANRYFATRHAYNQGKLFKPASYLHNIFNKRNRTFSALSRLPTRPRISSTRTALETALTSSEIETSTTPGPSASLTFVRGAKRDTFNPSHRKRKRRLGFLARLKDRHGRKILERRRAKSRSTLSH